VIEHSKTQSDQKGIIFSVDIQTGIPLIELDDDRIKQVLGNLIRNSLMYTPSGGKIIIQAKMKPSQGFLEISVQDSGTGIDPADLPHIFDRFYRADESRARLNGGSGLGLAIVKNFVEAHGGNVYADSPVFFDTDRTGYGTRIYFTLPINHS
jgi:signal transduction histidine kinase